MKKNNIVIDCGPSSPLEILYKVSQNLLRNQNNVFIGDSDIIEAQKKIFISGFYAYPLSISNSILDEENKLYAVVIHGAFQDPFLHNGQTNSILFDRALVLKAAKSNDIQYIILNDNIYMHNPQFTIKK